MKYFAIIFSVLTALALAVLGGLAAWRDYGLWAIAVCAAMLLALPLSSLLHEAGHMLFGAICKIKTVPKLSLFGSSCCKLMPKAHKNLRVRLFFTAVGGVLVNLSVVAIIPLVVLFTPAPAWLMFLVPSNAYLFILNVVPAQFLAGATDGLICNHLLNNTDTAKVMLAVLSVQAQVLRGTPIETAGKDVLFNLPQICEDDMNFIALTELRYEYFAAVGDEENAQKQKLRFEELKKEYL